MKSKQQKQEEALARKRKAFPSKIREWCNRQVGGTDYNYMLTHFGKDAADKKAAEATRYLLHMAEDAQVDRHGNPLEKKYITTTPN
jgi:hypothetical protein